MTLAKRLSIRGQAQSLQLTDTIYVAESGLLRISNVTLLLSDAFRTTRVFEVRGISDLESSSVKRFRATLIWLYGRANLTEVEVVGSSARTVLVKSGKAELDLTSVLVSRLAAVLVVFSTEEFPQTRSHCRTKIGS